MLIVHMILIQSIFSTLSFTVFKFFSVQIHLVLFFGAWKPRVFIVFYLLAILFLFFNHTLNAGVIGNICNFCALGSNSHLGF